MTLGMHAVYQVTAGCQIARLRTSRCLTSSHCVLLTANFVLSVAMVSAAADGTAVCQVHADSSILCLAPTQNCQCDLRHGQVRGCRMPALLSAAGEH